MKVQFSEPFTAVFVVQFQLCNNHSWAVDWL